MRVAYCRSRPDDWPTPGGAPAGWAVSRSTDRAGLETCLREEEPDAALVRLPRTAGDLQDLLSRVRVAAPGLPVVLVAPADREEDADGRAAHFGEEPHAVAQERGGKTGVH